MDLLDYSLDSTCAATEPALDLYTRHGLAHAAAGDWHAAAQAFESAVDAAERERIADVSRDHDAHEARLAAALTNLGQARAHQGALESAVALLRRAVAVRERMSTAKSAGALVVARALVDLAAVLGASGAADEAHATLLRAQALAAGSGSALEGAIADGLAQLGDRATLGGDASALIGA